MCVWVGISLKSAVTPLIDGLLIVEFWFIKSIVLTVLLPAESGLDTTSLCCSLSLSLSHTFPAGNPIWWWWVMSFWPIRRGITSVHIPTIHIHIHTLCVCVWERESKRDAMRHSMWKENSLVLFYVLCMQLERNRWGRVWERCWKQKRIMDCAGQDFATKDK